ncbi:amino acid permease [Bombilactobacillus folatiphilus]|uniref:Amino acid permease n=1 Tax=Bombilactobacillus folatiphilus TaxID=2923362 RepID=A0ABY4P8C3_9LACO|nr:amino acid permease [Bombilactobacillus folatiphilus]UQS81774.1 amino acid permease [Bombilactobacillus folatiphilus]
MKRQLTLFAALATVMGTVIGGGAFFKVAKITALTHNTWLSILVWPLAGFITLMAGLTIAELAAAFPENGGPVKYLSEIYGQKIAFLFGWSLIIVYYPANIAAISIIFGTQAQKLFNLPTTTVTWWALGCLASLVLVNWLGTKLSSQVQKITLIIKLIPIIAIIIAAIFVSPTNHVANAPLGTALQIKQPQDLGQALLATLFAYDGWLSIGNLAGELKKPERNLARAIIGGLLAVTIIYTLLNWSFLKIMPLHQVQNNQATAMLTAQHLFGQNGGKLLTLGILVSVYGAVNGHLMVGSRMPYTLGLQKQLPASHFFSHLNSKTQIPTNSLLFESLIAVVMILSGTFDSLTDMLVYVSWIFSVLLFIGVIHLRKQRPNLERPYKINWYPLPPILAILGGLFIVINTTITKPGLALAGIILTLSGLPVYAYQNRKRK